MKNYRVGYVTGGVVREIRKGAKRLGEAAKKPGLKDLEKLKKGRKAPKVKPDPYRHPYPREGREAPKVKPDPYRRGWEKLPKSKWKKPIDKFPGDPKKYTKPIDKFPADPKKWQPMKEGGRTGLKKGGPKPGTHDYFLLHKREKKKEGGRTGLKKGGPKPGTHDYFLLHKKREKKAFGGPSHSVRRAVKKILKKAKAKKDTESVRDVRAEGGRSTKISKRGPVYNKNTGRKIIR